MGDQAGPVGLRRRLSLAVTNGLHRIIVAGSGVALGGLPRAGGIPVLRGPGTGPEARERLGRVVAGVDSSGISRQTRWSGGGGFVVAEVTS